MMSDSGWPDMPNKHIVMLSIFLAAAAAAVGQEGSPATGSESAGETQAVASTTDAEISDEVQTQALESASTEDSNVTEPEISSTETNSAPDRYRPTERISEDRSVSFPIDI
jgi:hypothetical protein